MNWWCVWNNRYACYIFFGFCLCCFYLCFVKIAQTIWVFRYALILIPFKTVGLVLIIAYHYPKIKKGFINVNEISFDIFEWKQMLLNLGGWVWGLRGCGVGKFGLRLLRLGNYRCRSSFNWWSALRSLTGKTETKYFTGMQSEAITEDYWTVLCDGSSYIEEKS